MKQLSPPGKLVFLYLITNPYAHVSGIYVLNLKHAATDLGMALNTLSTHLDTLSKLSMCLIDEATEVVFVRKMMSYQGRGEKNLRSAAYHITEDLHGSYLAQEFLLEYPAVGKFLGERFRSSRISIPTALRFKVLERDSNRCCACGATPETASLEVDHVVPESRGGKTVLENLQTLCQPCNLGKSNRVSIKEDRVSRVGPPDPDPDPVPDPDSRILIPKHKAVPLRGKFENVKLADGQVEELRERFGESGMADRIEALSEWMASTGKKYSSHHATILRWERRNSNGTHQQNGTAGRGEVTKASGKTGYPPYVPKQ